VNTKRTIAGIRTAAKVRPQPKHKPAWRTRPNSLYRERDSRIAEHGLVAGMNLFLKAFPPAALELAREKWNRFNTTPNWEGVSRSHEGAYLAMIEASRG
jgi:hypothetical protein